LHTLVHSDGHSECYVASGPYNSTGQRATSGILGVTCGSLNPPM